MRCEWKQVKLGDVATVKGGKRLPKNVNLINTPNTHPYIRVRDLNDRVTLELNDSFLYVDDETQKGISRYVVNSDDIVISIVGTIGLVAKIGKTLDGANLTENCVKITNLQNIDKEYLFYYLKSVFGQQEIMRGIVGAVQQKLPIKNIQEITIKCPELIEQKKIAAILSALDEKIAINREINDNLEQQAAALFESWFVDYNPWSGIQPSEWTNAPLGTFVEIKRGGSPRPIQDYLSDSGLRWLKISDVTSLSSPFVLEIKEHIKEEGLKKTVFLHAGELVLSNSATPGIPKILDVDTCIHDGWLYFPKSELSKYYLYLFFKHIRKELVSLGNGSVFTNLKTDILKAFPATKADKVTLKKFDALVSPLFDAMLNADRENLKLATMRDSLLPKLMSGEIDVSAIQL